MRGVERIRFPYGPFGISVAIHWTFCRIRGST